MAINFPDSPSINDTYTVGDTLYTWDGTKWNAQVGSYLPDAIEVGNSKAEIIDSGSDGRFVVTTEGTERARVDGSGRLLVGTSSNRLGYKFQVEGTASDTGWGSLFHNANDTVGAILKLAKSRGTSVGSNTIVQSGDTLGRIDFDGTDGSTNQVAARISGQIDGTPGANDMPGRLVFSTTADGTSSPTERMRIANTGALGLSGANYGSSGQVLTSQGSGSAPQWVNAAGGAWNLVGSVTANNSSSVAFTSGISNTYNVYVLIGEGLVTAAAEYDYIRLRFSSDGGSSWITSSYEYFNGTNTFNKSNIELLSYYAGTSRSGNFILYIYNLRNSLYPQMFGTRINNSSAIYAADIQGALLNTSTINAMQLSTVYANIASGSFRLYGISNS